MSSKRRGPAVAKRQLVLRLRRTRLAAKKSQAEVAESLDWSASKVLRIENGHVVVATSDLLALMTLYGADETYTSEMIDLSRSARKPSILGSYRDVLTPEFADWLEHEAYAARIRQYESKFIPGVLQTGDYAQSVVRAGLGREAPQERVNRIVESRLNREQLLTGPDGPEVSFIVDESAVRRGIGHEDGRRDYADMISQLEQLKRLNTRGRRERQEEIEDDLNPNIGIQIVPFEMGSYQALRGPFELLEFQDPEDDNMVYFENPDGDVVIRETHDETAIYLDMFTELQKLLPSYASTDQYIDQVIELMEQGRNGVHAQLRR